MSKLRTHFTFRVDTWTPDGESIVEHIAGVEDYQVALATFRAACQRWPGTPITLRQGARVIEDSPAQAAVTHRPEGRSRVITKTRARSRACARGTTRPAAHLRRAQS
jgi:hypothetical protein